MTEDTTRKGDRVLNEFEILSGFRIEDMNGIRCECEADL